MLHLSGDTIAKILEVLPTITQWRTRGKEIEYHIVNKKTGRLATAEEALSFWNWLDQYDRWDLHLAHGITRSTFAKELAHWLIELNSPVLRSHAELRSWTYAVLDFTREALAQLGLALVSVDVHPDARDGHFGLEDIPEEPEYLRGIWHRGALRSKPFLGNPFAKSGWVTSEQDQYKVGGDGKKAYWLRNQGLPLVPLFTGGTANGPLCVPSGSLEVVDTGLATVRHDWLQTLDTFGVGPIFDDRVDYLTWGKGEIAADRVDAIRAKRYDVRQVRDEHRLASQQKSGGPQGTHEHREKGAQHTPEYMLAWSAFDETIYDGIAAMYEIGETPFPYMCGPLRERHGSRIDFDRLTAARDGLDAVIANPATGDPADKLTVQEGILRTAEAIEPLMVAKNLQRELALIREIASGKASYQLLRQEFQRGGANRARQYLMRAMN